MMRKILDKLFENQKLSILIPILIAALLYLLFVILGVAEDKINLIMSTPILSVIWFFGVFLVLYVQVRNARCPEGFLNVFELFVTIGFSIFAVAEAISCVASGFQSFNPLMCAGFVTYASVAWAHSKRTK